MNICLGVEEGKKGPFMTLVTFWSTPLDSEFILVIDSANCELPQEDN